MDLVQPRELGKLVQQSSARIYVISADSEKMLTESWPHWTPFVVRNENDQDIISPSRPNARMEP